MWLYGVPNLVGGNKWYDLMQLNSATLTSMSSGHGWSTAGPPGQVGSMSFNGTSDYLTGSVSPALDFTSGLFTVGMWVYFKALSATAGLISKRLGTGSTNGFGIVALSNGELFLELFNGAVHSINTAATVTTGKWYRLLFVRTGASTGAIYVNGALISSSGTLANPVAATGYPVIIGQVNSGIWFNGEMTDISIWGRALSVSEAQEDYILSNTGYPGVLNRIGSYPLSLVGGTLYYASISAVQGNSPNVVKMPELLRSSTETTLSSIPKQIDRIINTAEANSASVLKQPNKASSAAQSNLPILVKSILKIMLANQSQSALFARFVSSIKTVQQSNSTTVLKQPEPNNTNTTQSNSSSIAPIPLLTRSATQSNLSINNEQLSHIISATQSESVIFIKQPQPGVYEATQGNICAVSQSRPMGFVTTQPNIALGLILPVKNSSTTEQTNPVYFANLSRFVSTAQLTSGQLSKQPEPNSTSAVQSSSSTLMRTPIVSNNIAQANFTSNFILVAKVISCSQDQVAFSTRFVAKIFTSTQPQVVFLTKYVLRLVGPITQACVAFAAGRGFTPSSLLVFVARAYVDLFEPNSVTDSYTPGFDMDNFLGGGGKA
jgi:hypothetical protein